MKYIPEPEIDNEEIKWQEHTLQQMNEALGMLHEEQRKTIELFYLKKYSYEQITETGYTFMQVKSYIQNGKRNLKTILLKKLGKGQPMNEQQNILPSDENKGESCLKKGSWPILKEVSRLPNNTKWKSGSPDGGMESDALEGLQTMKQAKQKAVSAN